MYSKKLIKIIKFRYPSKYSLIMESGLIPPKSMHCVDQQASWLYSMAMRTSGC